jgi:metallophosphoesterase (TIGR00282 family)
LDVLGIPYFNPLIYQGVLFFVKTCYSRGVKILFFGDIVGRPGREGIAKILPSLKKKYNPDIIGANVENLAHGHGISNETLREITEAGVDFFTSGNHVWEGKDSKELLLDKALPLARPANYPPGAYGKGFYTVQVATKRLLVINLMGRVFMKTQIDCPMRKADEILGEFDEGEFDAVFVDFHAETTSEKRVLGFYLDGRVSCMVGTHTHVPTADEQVLPKGTGYLTDAGMCGVKDSSIGVDKDIMIKELLSQVPQKKEIAEGAVEIGAVLFDIGKDGKCKKVKRIREIVD